MLNATRTREPTAGVHRTTIATITLHKS